MVIFNWVFAFMYIYFVSVVFEHWEIGIADVNLTRHEAQYLEEEKMRKRVAMEEKTRQAKFKIQQDTAAALDKA